MYKYKRIICIGLTFILSVTVTMAYAAKKEDNKVSEIDFVVPDSSALDVTSGRYTQIEEVRKVKNRLADLKGFEKKMESKYPDLILMDIKMPEMDGLTLFTIMREREYRVPVVFLSAHGDIPSTVEAMKKGSLDFLEKPLDSQKLCQLLSDILKKDRATRNAGMEPEEAK